MPNKRPTKTKRAARPAATPPPPPPPAPPARREVSVTTFRLYRDQLAALQRLALDRKITAGEGRTDASVVLREILDQVLPGLAAGTPGRP
jgi:hypothetical protein